MLSRLVTSSFSSIPASAPLSTHRYIGASFMSFKLEKLAVSAGWRHKAEDRNL